MYWGLVNIEKLIEIYEWGRYLVVGTEVHDYLLLVQDRAHD